MVRREGGRGCGEVERKGFLFRFEAGKNVDEVQNKSGGQLTSIIIICKVCPFSPLCVCLPSELCNHTLFFSLLLLLLLLILSLLLLALPAVEESEEEAKTNAAGKDGGRGS